MDGTTGIPKPLMHRGNQNQLVECAAKLLAYVRGTAHDNPDQWIATIWALFVEIARVISKTSSGRSMLNLCVQHAQLPRGQRV